MHWVIPLLMIVVLTVAAALYAYWNYDARMRRRYEAEFATREQVNDDELFRRFFDSGETAPDVPGEVRRTFAKYMGYPAQKLLPDDDLSFFWAEMDMADLIRELETAFGIEITGEDAANTPCTIRAVTSLVTSKRGPRGNSRDEGGR